MKKILTLTLIVVASTLTAMAQGRHYRRLPAPPAPHYANQPAYQYERRPAIDAYVGLRLGLNVSTVSSDDRYLDGGSAKTGLNIGIVGGVRLAPATPVYLEAGLLYSEKGGKGNYNGPFTYQMNYLEMPLLLKYRIGLNRQVSLQPFAGVYAAVGISGKMKDFDQRKAYSSFADDAFQRFDGGLRLGCGLQFSHLYLEAGYDLGLANVSRNYFDSSRTGCFFATAGINF